MTGGPVECPFCRRVAAGDGLVARSPFASAFPDAFPVASGHTLVVPNRHGEDLFALPAELQQQLWLLVGEVIRQLRQNLAPDGFNVGVNVGEAAGQTVEHAHVHVIPRRRDDVLDPRGGVRWVIPQYAAYWRE